MRAPARRRAARGLSLIELLVGTAIGLIVAAAAAGIVSAHLRESRRAQLEARLMQDLRGAADLVARDLRRAGYWAASASGVRGNDGAALPIANPYGLEIPTADGVRLSFDRNAAAIATVGDDERFGFRLRNGAIEMQLGAANWQALSDAGTLVVTAFTVVPRVDEINLADFCERPCPAGSATCPPRQLVRSFALTLTARSATDPALTRTLRSGVRTRNDAVVGSCAG